MLIIGLSENKTGDSGDVDLREFISVVERVGGIVEGEGEEFEGGMRAEKVEELESESDSVFRVIFEYGMALFDASIEERQVLTEEGRDRWKCVLLSASVATSSEITCLQISNSMYQPIPNNTKTEVTSLPPWLPLTRLPSQSSQTHPTYHSQSLIHLKQSHTINLPHPTQTSIKHVANPRSRRRCNHLPALGEYSERWRM